MFMKPIILVINMFDGETKVDVRTPSVTPRVPLTPYYFNRNNIHVLSVLIFLLGNDKFFNDTKQYVFCVVLLNICPNIFILILLKLLSSIEEMFNIPMNSIT